MQELDFIPCWAPIYSPDYNPIEFYFSILKRLVKRERLQDIVKNRNRKFDEIVKQVHGRIPNDKINNCILHVFNLYGLKFD